MGIGEIKKILKDAGDEIRSDYRAEIVGIFGSFARGEGREGSDVDIIVRFSEGATLFDLVGLGDFLEERIGIKVDVVSERSIREEIRDDIMAELVRI